MIIEFEQKRKYKMHKSSTYNAGHAEGYRIEVQI